jgi:dTDP-4-dehydrorhamnose 3,5-epimerase
MKFVEELLPGTYRVQLNRFQDSRGSFVKTYAKSVFDEALQNVPGASTFDFREEFYSTSARDVIRGMHFQLPPHDHVKLVYCAAGSVLDVLLDLRQGPGYGHTASLVLDSESPSLVLVPRGVAHGFRSLTDRSLMVYKTSTEHAPSHDAGLRFDSFGFNWGCEQPVLSERDQRHPAFGSFQSPFAAT